MRNTKFTDARILEPLQVRRVRGVRGVRVRGGRGRVQRQLEVAAARGEARVQVARHALAGPRLRVERAQPLLLGVAGRAAHALRTPGGGQAGFQRRKGRTPNTHLQIPRLGYQPLLDELLRIQAEAQEEFPVGFQLVDCVHLREVTR